MQWKWLNAHLTVKLAVFPVDNITDLNCLILDDCGLFMLPDLFEQFECD